MKYNSLFTADGFPDEKRFGKNIFHMLYKERLAEISKKTAEGEERPPLLLHSCCGPCSSAVITKLAPFFKLTVFYYNPNIDTLDEYMRRAACQNTLRKILTADLFMKYQRDWRKRRKEAQGARSASNCA